MTPYHEVPPAQLDGFAAAHVVRKLMEPQRALRWGRHFDFVELFFVLGLLPAAALAVVAGGWPGRVDAEGVVTLLAVVVSHRRRRGDSRRQRQHFVCTLCAGFFYFFLLGISFLVCARRSVLAERLVRSHLAVVSVLLSTITGGPAGWGVGGGKELCALENEAEDYIQADVALPKSVRHEDGIFKADGHPRQQHHRVHNTPAHAS